MQSNQGQQNQLACKTLPFLCTYRASLVQDEHQEARAARMLRGGSGSGRLRIKTLEDPKKFEAEVSTLVNKILEAPCSCSRHMSALPQGNCQLRYEAQCTIMQIPCVPVGRRKHLFQMHAGTAERQAQCLDDLPMTTAKLPISGHAQHLSRFNTAGRSNQWTNGARLILLHHDDANAHIVFSQRLWLQSLHHGVAS